MYAGVDEAGRGPVLGPLVVAGVHATPSQLPEGIADSKRLTAETRQRLHDELLAASIQHHVVVVPAERISRQMEAGTTLNQIELAAFAEILEALGPERAVVDALGRDVAATAGWLEDRLGGACAVEARIGADASDPLVGAASILAKVRRDRAMTELEARVGSPMGSGYPSDPATRAFLTTWRANRSGYPPGARTTWATLTRMGFGTAKLADFHPPKGGKT